MADTRSAVIEIKTLEAVQNVQDLKNNITALKKKLDDVSTSTEDYADITKQLSQNQAALRNVMNGTNSTFQQSITAARGLDSSYNSLVQQLKEATQEWRTIPRYLSDVDREQGVVNQAWTEAAEKVNALRTELKEMDADTGNYTRNVGNYKSALEGLGGTMGQVKQVGGDMVNGLQAMTGVLGLVGADTTTLNTIMTGLRTTIGLLTGVKGIAGFLTGLKATTKAQQQNTAATIAGTTANKASTIAVGAGTAAHAASTAAKTAETTATWSLKTAVDALKAALSGGLSVVISVITTALSGLVSWLFSAKDATDELAEEAESAADRAAKVIDKINDKLSEGSRQRKLEIRVMEAEGKKEEEIHQRQQEIYDEEIADRQRQIEENERFRKQVEDWNADYEKARKREKKQFKERKEEQDEQLKATNEQTKALREEIAELRIAKDEEQQLYDAKLRNPNKGGNDNSAEEARREAERALKEIQELFNSSLTGVDAINAKYDEALKKLEDNLKKVRVSEETANQARLIIEKQRTKALQEEYAKQFTDKYNSYKKSIDTIRKENDETLDVYKGLIPELKNTYEERVKLYDEQSKRTKDRLEQDLAEAKRILGDVIGEDQWSQYLLFMTKSNEELKGMYRVMLADEEAFAKAWPEPFINALKSMGPLILNSEAQTKKDLTQYVKDLMNAYKEAVQDSDVETAAALREKLIGNPPVAEDEQLRAAAEDFVKRMDQKIAEQLLNGDNPLAVYFKGTNWDEQLGIHLEKFRDTLDDENATFKEKYDARLKILEAYNKKYSIFMNSYGKATSNVMETVADAWNEALQAQVKAGKKSEEQAKASFQFVKGLQIGAAVINTAGAVVQALADTTVPSYYVKVANAAAALAAGTAQIIKISSTDFNGGGGAANASMPNMVERPNPSVQYTIGLNPADYAEAQAQNPIRAFVVDKDLSEGLDEYNRKQNETSF